MKKHILQIALLLFSVSAFSQIRCDTTSGMIFTYLEHQPIPSLTDVELENQLNKSVDIALLNTDYADYLYVLYFINCKGEDFDYKLAKRVKGFTKLDTTSELSRTLLDTIQSLLTWTPGHHPDIKNGKQFDRPVDFQGSYTIQIDKNRMHILTETEKKRHFKSKRKK